MIPFIAPLLQLVLPLANTPDGEKVREAALPIFPDRGNERACRGILSAGLSGGEGLMGIWHQIASATMTIAFAISLFIASQMYVGSRLTAGELEKSPVQKLRNLAYRTPRDL